MHRFYPQMRCALTTRSVNALTPRELQIAVALLQGSTTREIADRCGINRQTVKNYVTVIYEKLGIGGRRELHQLAEVSRLPDVLAPRG